MTGNECTTAPIYVLLVNFRLRLTTAPSCGALPAGHPAPILKVPLFHLSLRSRPEVTYAQWYVMLGMKLKVEPWQSTR